MSRWKNPGAAGVDAQGAPNEAPASAREVVLVIIGIVAVLGAVGFLSVLFSGTVTVEELNEITRSRREAAVPPTTPDGPSDTRRMLWEIEADLGSNTATMRYVQFRSGLRWSTWTSAALASSSPRSPFPTAPRPIGPSDDPLRDFMDRASPTGGPSLTLFSNGSAGEVPEEMTPPELPAETYGFELEEVTALTEMAEADATARQERGLESSLRGWVSVFRTGDEIRVEVEYESAETGAVTATVVLDADGELVEVRR